MNRRRLCLSAMILGMLLTSCATTRTPEREIEDIDRTMAHPQPNTTRFGSAVERFGTMLRAYPNALLDTISIEVQPVKNTSGVTEGLPTDLAPVLRNILIQMGKPVEVVDFDPEQLHIDYKLMVMGQIDRATMVRLWPNLSVRGSITEGETRLLNGRSWQMDLLIPIDDEDADLGGDWDREIEVTTLAIDLQLYNRFTMTSIDRLAESYRVDVVRSEKTYAFGIFFEGSGLGFRSRLVGIQSKSRALRMASELAMIHLLGRYFQVPWWRVVNDVAVDEKLVDWYRQRLESEGLAADRLKMLLYAHGVDVDLKVQGLTPQEVEFSYELKRAMGMEPFADNDYEFITRLWMGVPIELAEKRMDSLRRRWQMKALAQQQAAQSSSATHGEPPQAEELSAPATGDAAPASLPVPTVAVCCPFRFEPLPDPPPDERP